MAASSYSNVSALRVKRQIIENGLDVRTASSLAPQESPRQPQAIANQRPSCLYQLGELSVYVGKLFGRCAAGQARPTRQAGIVSDRRQLDVAKSLASRGG
jgi:hypothetical protein